MTLIASRARAAWSGSKKSGMVLLSYVTSQDLMKQTKSESSHTSTSKNDPGALISIEICFQS